jgi:hypothetical protein
MILAYCDYIAHIIQKNLKRNDLEGMIDSVGKVNFDLNDDGSYRSTKKVISVVDKHGTGYTITIEENRNEHPI